MKNAYKVSTIQEIPDGSMKQVSVNGELIAIAHIDTAFYAVADTCSHEQCGFSSDGMLDGTTLICGCHGAMFDITNGKVMSLPATTDVASYEVDVRENDIYLLIP